MLDIIIVVGMLILTLLFLWGSVFILRYFALVVKEFFHLLNTPLSEIQREFEQEFSSNNIAEEEWFKTMHDSIIDAMSKKGGGFEGQRDGSFIDSQRTKTYRFRPINTAAQTAKVFALSAKIATSKIQQTYK